MLKSRTTLLSLYVLCYLLIFFAILVTSAQSVAQHALRRVISFWNLLACARRRTCRHSSVEQCWTTGTAVAAVCI